MSMYYEQFSSDKSSCLVLLHSGGMGGVEWQPQIKPLSKKFRLLIPDLPGHARSPLVENQTLCIQTMACAVIEMLNKENIRSAHFVGSSMGGAVALWLGLNHPEIVEKLVIYRIGYCKDENTYEQTLSMADADYWKQYGLSRWLSQLHAPQGGKDAWKTVIRNVSKILDPKTSDHNHRIEDLSRIHAQTLLIAGDRDPLIPVKTVLQMADTIPNAAVWIMPNATHITGTNTWRAGMFSEELIRFLKDK